MMKLDCQLSHIALSIIQDLLAKGMVEGVKLNPLYTTMDQCKSCEYGKAVCKPIGNVCKPKYHEYSGDEVHMDVWGPSDMQILGHKKFYASFTDNYTQYTHLYLLDVKSNTLEPIKHTQDG